MSQYLLLLRLNSALPRELTTQSQSMSQCLSLLRLNSALPRELSTKHESISFTAKVKFRAAAGAVDSHKAVVGRSEKVSYYNHGYT